LLVWQTTHAYECNTERPKVKKIAFTKYIVMLREMRLQIYFS